MESDEKRETLADIVAAMHNDAELYHAAWLNDPNENPEADDVSKLLANYARRIEAAAKRDKAEAEAEALAVGGIVEAARHKPGNAAATRAALRALRDASRDFYNQILNSKYSEILDKYTCVKQGFPAVLDLRSAFPMANYALSAPPRNCDVGSEEEQSRRYEAFCEVHHMQCDKGCSACPCSKKSGVSCELYWAQMPYAEEGAGE